MTIDGMKYKEFEGSFAGNNNKLWDNLPDSCSTMLFPIFLKVKLLTETERKRQVMINNPKMYKGNRNTLIDSSLDLSRTL